MTTIDRIRTILREDPFLTEDEADNLTELLRVAYSRIVEIKALVSEAEKSGIVRRPKTLAEALDAYPDI